MRGRTVGESRHSQRRTSASVSAFRDVPYPASEILEIIQPVERSRLLTKRTPENRSTPDRSHRAEEVAERVRDRDVRNVGLALLFHGRERVDCLGSGPLAVPLDAPPDGSEDEWLRRAQD
jgi:hypothetical protein